MLTKSKTVRLLMLALGCAFILCLHDAARAQDAAPPQDDEDMETRQIKLSDFTKKRPAAPANAARPRTNTANSSGDSASWNAPTYARVKAKPAARPRPARPAPRPAAKPAPRAAKPSGAATKPAPPAASEIREVGVTLWRLRPARETDNGPAVTIIQGGKPTVLTPERIEGTAPVALGDRVRLSVESPRDGFLYVINREQYADGTMGAPTLIFPTTRVRGGDNSVTAGRLIDIPDSRDPQPFFTLTSSQRPGQPQIVGELLTIMIAPRPLEGVTIGRAPVVLPVQQVARWEEEWGADPVEMLELNGGAGRTWTEAEKLASETTRGLTQEEPTPQTVYRVAAKPTDPVMVTVQLLYGQLTPAPTTARQQ